MKNNFFCIGKLKTDPKLKRIKNGELICNFSLIPYENYKSEYKLKDKIYIIAKNKTAEICTKYLKINSKTIIEGNLKEIKFKDINGKLKTIKYVLSTNIKFIFS